MMDHAQSFSSMPSENLTKTTKGLKKKIQILKDKAQEKGQDKSIKLLEAGDMWACGDDLEGHKGVFPVVGEAEKTCFSCRPLRDTPLCWCHQVYLKARLKIGCAESLKDDFRCLSPICHPSHFGTSLLNIR